LTETTSGCSIADVADEIKNETHSRSTSSAAYRLFLHGMNVVKRINNRKFVFSLYL